MEGGLYYIGSQVRLHKRNIDKLAFSIKVCQKTRAYKAVLFNNQESKRLTSCALVQCTVCCTVNELYVYPATSLQSRRADLLAYTGICICVSKE